MNNGSDSIVRKLAAKILCQLGSESGAIENSLCELFNFSNFAGKVRISTSLDCD